MKYGMLCSGNLVEKNNHILVRYDGTVVNECSTSKCWNDEVEYFNYNVVVLANDEEEVK